MINRKYILIVSLLLAGLALSCTQQTSTKSEAVETIKRDAIGWTKFASQQFALEHSSQSIIEPQVMDNGAKGEWFNITYPEYNATIYCTYMPITAESFLGAVEDSYRLAYSHASRADGIEPLVFEDSIRNAFGIMYNIDGDVATPIQFFVTDSTSHFLRGSFYYDKIVRADSVRPLTEFVREDITHLMQSIEWLGK